MVFMFQKPQYFLAVDQDIRMNWLCSLAIGNNSIDMIAC